MRFIVTKPRGLISLGDKVMSYNKPALSFSEVFCDETFTTRTSDKSLTYTTNNNGAWCMGDDNLPSIIDEWELTGNYSNFTGSAQISDIINTGTGFGFSSTNIYTRYNNQPFLGDPFLTSSIVDYAVSLQFSFADFVRFYINVPGSTALYNYNLSSPGAPQVGVKYSLIVNFATAQVFSSIDGSPRQLIFSPNGISDGALSSQTYPASTISGRDFYFGAYNRNTASTGSFDITID